jgi:hypothetical protein
MSFTFSMTSAMAGQVPGNDRRSRDAIAGVHDPSHLSFFLFPREISGCR